MRKSVLRIAFGFVLIAIGVAGLILPGIQGIALIAAGLILIAQDIPFVSRWLSKLEARYPRLRTTLGSIRARDGSLRLGKTALVLVFASILWSIVALLVVYAARHH